MSISHFDPFEDRLSRDIRNVLSKAFMESLNKKSMVPVEAAAERFLKMGIADFYHAYIKDRLQKYNASFAAIVDKGEDVIRNSLVMWDQELFFEVHELLEEAWHEATGPRKEILQGLIRAAGVYVHLSRGNIKGAEKMAFKAIDALKTYRNDVPEYVDLDKIFASLDRLDPQPPKLLEE